MIPLRLYVYAAIALAIGGLVLREHVVVRQRNAAIAETKVERQRADSAVKTIETMKADNALSRETSHVLQTRLSDIEHTRAPVSVRCFAANPVVPTEGRAAAGADAAAVDAGPAEALRDIGSALESARIETLGNNARFVTLQEWETARAH